MIKFNFRVGKNLIFGKKAQSSVITTVIIILIVIIGVVILFNIFFPLLQEKNKEVDINPLKTSLEIKDVSSFITGSFRVRVQRGSDDNEMESIRVVVYDEKENSKILVIYNNLPKPGESKTYFFSPIENFSKINKISAYPIISGKTGLGNTIDNTKFFEIPLGLVFWFGLSDNFEDITGKYNLQESNGVSFIEIDGRKSAYFDSGYLNFGNSTEFNINKEFVISFFIKTNSNNGFILKKGSILPNYLVKINDNGAVNFSYSSFGKVEGNDSKGLVSDDKWHHIVITNSGLFIDGKLDNLFFIMKSFDSNSDNLISGEGFNGYISDLMFFNKSLDYSQIKGIYNLQK